MKKIHSSVFAIVLLLPAISAHAATVVYGVSIFNDQFTVIDQSTGNAVSLGALATQNIRGLAWDSSTNTMYGSDISAGPELVTIDRLSGSDTVVGSLGGFTQLEGLAYDSTTDTLYGTDTDSDELVTIDRATGAPTAVGALGFAQVAGLAYDSSTNTLYGSDIISNQLITIDPITGAGTAVGGLGFGQVVGLAYDESSDTLYGSDLGTNQLIAINRATGAATAVGGFGFTDMHGLAAVNSPNSGPGSITMKPNPVGDWVCLPGSCSAATTTRTAHVTLISGDIGPPVRLQLRFTILGGGANASSTIQFFFNLDADITSATLLSSSGNITNPAMVTNPDQGNVTLLMTCGEGDLCVADLEFELDGIPGSGSITDTINQFVDSPGAPAQILNMTFAQIFALEGRLPATPGGDDWQAWHDPNLDITWAADANINGQQLWDDQVAWASSLAIGGISGWRLPSADVNGDDSYVDCTGGIVDCTDDEMQYLFWEEGISFATPGPFSNVQSTLYWSGTDFGAPPDAALTFSFLDGSVIGSNKNVSPKYGWAVTDGDVGAMPVRGQGDITGVLDVSSDGVPDIAHLTFTDRPKVRYYSGANGKKIRGQRFFGTNWRDVAVATAVDGNADGVADDQAVAVLGTKPGEGKHGVEVRRADNGAFIRKIFFLSSNWIVLDVAIIDDRNGDGLTDDALIAVLAYDPTKPSAEQIRVQVRRLSNGSFVANVNFYSEKWTPMALEGVVRPGAGSLLAVLAHRLSDRTNAIQARRLDGSLQRTTGFWTSDWVVRDVSILLDADGNGNPNDPAYLVMATNLADSRNKVQARRVSDGNRLNNIFVLGSNWDSWRVAGTADISGNQREEVAGLGQKHSDGTIIIQVKDYSDEDTTVTIEP